VALLLDDFRQLPTEGLCWPPPMCRSLTVIHTPEQFGYQTQLWLKHAANFGEVAVALLRE